jgi:DNA-binding SARP family transcriptional activator
MKRSGSYIFGELLKQFRMRASLNQTAHYGIMRCYARQGKRDLALRQYQRCRRELHEQLGAEPGHTIQKFYQHLANPH